MKIIDHLKNTSHNHSVISYPKLKDPDSISQNGHNFIIGGINNCWDRIFHTFRNKDSVKDNKYIIYLKGSLSEKEILEYANYLINDLKFKLKYLGKRKQDGYYAFEILYDEFLTKDLPDDMLGQKARFTETRAYVFPLRWISQEPMLIKKVLYAKNKGLDKFDPLYALYLAAYIDKHQNHRIFIQRNNRSYLTLREFYNRLVDYRTNYGGVINLYSADNVKRFETNSKGVEKLHELLLENKAKRHFPKYKFKIGDRILYKNIQFSYNNQREYDDAILKFNKTKKIDEKYKVLRETTTFKVIGYASNCYLIQTEETTGYKGGYPTMRIEGVAKSFSFPQTRLEEGVKRGDKIKSICDLQTYKKL